MESNTFYDIYLEELKNLPQGTPEEETALLKKLTEGDKTAVSRLTELKLTKAVQIAEEYHDRGLPAGDLVQEANMALFLFASEYENGDFDAQMEKKVRAAIEFSRSPFPSVPDVPPPPVPDARKYFPLHKRAP